MNRYKTDPRPLILMLLLGLCLAPAIWAGDSGPAAMTKADMVREAKAAITQVGAEQAKAMFDEGGHYFLDTREEREFRTGHVPGAINLPRGWLEFRIEDLVPERNAGIIVYCRSGDRSGLAVQTLLRMGYIHAVNLEGGWLAWDEANYPVE